MNSTATYVLGHEVSVAIEKQKVSFEWAPEVVIKALTAVKASSRLAVFPVVVLLLLLTWLIVHHRTHWMTAPLSVFLSCKRDVCIQFLTFCLTVTGIWGVQKQQMKHFFSLQKTNKQKGKVRVTRK